MSPKPAHVVVNETSQAAILFDAFCQPDRLSDGNPGFQSPVNGAFGVLMGEITSCILGGVTGASCHLSAVPAEFVPRESCVPLWSDKAH